MAVVGCVGAVGRIGPVAEVVNKSVGLGILVDVDDEVEEVVAIFDGFSAEISFEEAAAAVIPSVE